MEYVYLEELEVAVVVALAVQSRVFFTNLCFPFVLVVSRVLSRVL